MSNFMLMQGFFYEYGKVRETFITNYTPDNKPIFKNHRILSGNIFTGMFSLSDETQMGSFIDLYGRSWLYHLIVDDKFITFMAFHQDGIREVHCVLRRKGSYWIGAYIGPNIEPCYVRCKVFPMPDQLIQNPILTRLPDWIKT